MLRFTTVLFLSLFLFLLISCSSSPTLSTQEKGVKIGLIYTTDQMNELTQQKIDPNIDVRTAIESSGGVPITLAPTQSEVELKENMAKLEGLLIPGGQDIDPKLYGELPDPKLEYHDINFDNFEIKLIDNALKQKIPVMGICRGLQILNVYFGGTLYQDIPTKYKASPKFNNNIIHRTKVDGKSVMTKHSINLLKDSKLQKITSTDKMEVNSFHHQGIKKLGKGLKVSAISDDGFIEGIEGIEGIESREGTENKTHHVFGVQFHPEVAYEKSNDHGYDSNNPKYPAIFNYFISCLVRSGAQGSAQCPK